MTDPIDAIAQAVLYEGYILYPYRPTAVKNQRRWNFGGVYPRAYSEQQTGADRWVMQTECLAEADETARLTVTIRFLRVVERRLFQDGSAVPALAVDGRELRSWQEAAEERIEVATDLAALVAGPLLRPIALPADRQTEPVLTSDGRVAGEIVRERAAITGSVEVSAQRARGRVLQLTLRVTNTTPLADGTSGDREEALGRTMASTHAVLRIAGGRFLSLADPPAEARDLAERCRNEGVWPVLVGAPGQDDTILASPIILDDHPEVAPESPGDLFDSAEIDEILSLRILTLSDGEKAEMREADERARMLLERTEALGPDDMMKLHGVMRRPRVTGEGA